MGILQINQNKKIQFCFSSEKDEIIPPKHMKELYEKSTEGTRIFHSIPNAHHNDVGDICALMKTIEKFVKKEFDESKSEYNMFWY